jgi:hypothetical protein
MEKSDCIPDSMRSKFASPTFAFSANLSGPSLGSIQKKGLRLSTHFEDRPGRFSEEVAGAEASLADE